MNIEKRDFNKEAVLWDEHPGRLKVTSDIAAAISKQIILRSEMEVMDFGCGTGLLTLQIQPYVRSVIGVDSSEKMLDMFNIKISKLKLDKVNTALINLDKGDILDGNYDLVLSSMTLHHIKDIENLFDQFYKITTPGGYLCIADLDLDEGQFHDDNTGVFHFGFDRKTLSNVFAKAGFENVKAVTASEVVKPNLKGEMKRFTIFLMMGQKK